MTNRIRLALTVAGAAIALAGCSNAAKSLTQDEAKAIVDKAEASWTSGDTAKIMAFYAPGAVMFDVVAPAPTTNRGVQTKWTDSFVAMKPSNLRVPDKRVQVLDADTIIASGTGTVDAAAPKPGPVSIRYTDVYQKQADGNWLIVHEHLSDVPKGGAPAA